MWPLWLATNKGGYQFIIYKVSTDLPIIIADVQNDL